MTFKKNQALLDQAKNLIPIGAQTYSKSYRYFVGNQAPFFMNRGKGPVLYDIDGNKYIDFICSLGAVTLGYNFKATNRAIKKQLRKGIIFSTQSQLEVELASKLIKKIPWAESVKFLKNGSDATSTAIKLARAYTSKDIILMSGYHGMDDWSIGTSKNQRGVPDAVKDLTDVFDYNDLKHIESKLKQYQGNVAAIILEPIQGNGPSKDYLTQLKKIAHNHDALLVFDEVVSGFRYALGGASELYGVSPDLAAFGKGMANGMPISVVLGKSKILKLIEEDVFVSTTFGGETLSIAAAIATIDYMTQFKTQARITELGKMVYDEIALMIQQLDLDAYVYQYGLYARNGIMFRDFEDKSGLLLQSYFQKRLLEEGILAFSVFNFMHMHKTKHINKLLHAIRNILGEIKEITTQTREINKDEIINPIFKRNK